RSRALPGLESALAGMGAVAIGLNLATGWRMTRSGVADRPGAAIMVATALTVGVLRWPLLPVLLAIIPLSLLLVARETRR
ncbi:MAG: hypothetical protein JO264_06940, partial [Acidisphaera sp.]|nr:hypothetical protein [Acidisphaera sp.]